MRGMLGPKAFGAVAIDDWIIMPHAVWGCYFISNQNGVEWSGMHEIYQLISKQKRNGFQSGTKSLDPFLRDIT